MIDPLSLITALFIQKTVITTTVIKNEIKVPTNQSQSISINDERKRSEKLNSNIAQSNSNSNLSNHNSSGTENSVHPNNISSISDNTDPIQNIIYKYFGEEAAVATAVFKCESGLNRTSVNWDDAKITGYPSWGIAQLNRPEFTGWDDPETNIAMAKEMHIRRGFQPWSCYNHMGYLAYLK